MIKYYNIEHLLTLIAKCDSNQLYWFNIYKFGGNDNSSNRTHALCMLMDSKHIPDCCKFIEEMLLNDYKKPLFVDIF